MRVAWAVLVVAAWGCVHGRGGGAGDPGVVIPPEVYEPADRDDLLSPRDVLQRIEASPKLYEFAEAEGIVDPDAELQRFWPEGPRPFANPAVRVEADGVRRVVDAPDAPATARRLQRARAELDAGRLAEAARLADELIAAEPDAAKAHLLRGDCELRLGHPAGAIASYEKASALAPLEARAHAARAEALLELRQTEEARRAFARALARSPRDPAVVNRIRRDDGLPFTVAPGIVAPRVHLQPRGDDLVIQVDPTAPHWFSFGMCKALWMGEPGMRKERTGSEEHRFTALEEHECLVTLGVTYLLSQDNEEEEFTPDADVERVMAVHEDGLENALVLYELASRRYSHVMLVIPEEQREQVERFVLEYVLVPRGDAPRPDEDEESPAQRYEARAGVRR